MGEQKKKNLKSERDHLIKDSKTLVSSHHFCNEGQQHLIRKKEEVGGEKEIALLTGFRKQVSLSHTCAHTYYYTEAKHHFYNITKKKLDVAVNIWNLPMFTAWPLSLLWICMLSCNSVRATVFPTVMGL